jgi:ParB family chromosome partitioning protein
MIPSGDQIGAEELLLDTSCVLSSPFNLRCDEASDHELEISIASKGLIQPIVVRRSRIAGKFDLICGHRRLAAIKSLGWSKVPALLVDVHDKGAFEMALAENLQRRSLDPLEEAEAFRRYIYDYGWGGVSELARRIGKTKGYVSHRVLLLELPDSVRHKLADQLLTVSQATELIWIEDDSLREHVADIVAKNNLSTRETRRAVRLLNTGSHPITSLRLQGSDQAFSPTALEMMTEVKKAILSLRSSMFVLDSVMYRLDAMGESGRRISKKILEQRVCLHDMLDKLIHEKLTLSRELRKYQ